MKIYKIFVKLLVPLVTLAMTMSASALDGSRSSANYTIGTDTIDAGGRRITSANYTMDDSADCFGGISSVVSPPEMLKHGYIGQLYEVTSLVVTAIPASVSEDSNSQLGAIATLDDATILAVAGSNVNWGAASYPIALINTGGLLTPASVYTNTTGTISGYYLGASNSISLLVLDTNPDNFGNYASDGIPDSWQIGYFGLTNVIGIASVDPDGDYYNNLQEFQAGTDPTHSRSALRITAIGREGNNIRVTWACVGGHGYILQGTEPFIPAGYSGGFADASPVVSVAGVGESTTNYLDVGAAYAPVLTPPGGQAPTNGTPSTVNISANSTRGLADASSNSVSVGSLLMLGTFSISESAIQSNFYARNVSAIMSAFTPYSTPFAVGDGSDLSASWDVSLSAAGFAGQKIYLLAIDAPTVGKASQMGIFTAPSWVFPEEGGEISIDLEEVSDFVVGAQGGALTIKLPIGPPYTFDDTARLTALPGRARFYRIRLVP